MLRNYNGVLLSFKKCFFKVKQKEMKRLEILSMNGRNGLERVYRAGPWSNRGFIGKSFLWQL